MKCIKAYNIAIMIVFDSLKNNKIIMIVSNISHIYNQKDLFDYIYLMEE